MVFSRRKKQLYSEIQPQSFLCMGAGKNQLMLIRAARELGYRVIAIDKDKDAIGFEEADHKIYCSLLKPKQILSFLYNNPVFTNDLKGVGTRSFGKIAFSTAIVANRLSLPGTPHQNLHSFATKRKLKKLCDHLNIATPNYYIFEKTKNTHNLKAWKKYLPLVIRPFFGHAKRDTYLLKSIEDVKYFLENTNTNKKYVVDRYLEGREVTVLGFCENKKFHLLCIIDRYTSKTSPYFADICHRYPSTIADSQLSQSIIEHLQHICTATYLNQTPVVAEFLIVTENGKKAPYLIECAPEAGGEYLAEYLIPNTFEKSNYFQDLVHLFTGTKLAERLDAYQKPSKELRICFILQKHGQLKEIQLPSALWKHPGFIFAEYLKKPGDFTRMERGNLDRLAVFGLHAPLHDEKLDLFIEGVVQDTIISYED